MADVPIRPELQLPTLAPFSPLAGAESELVIVTGPAALWSRVKTELALTDVAEFHVHGLPPDNRPGSGPILLLAPEGGQDRVTMEDIRATTLPRRPVVLLAACHAGD